MYSVSLGPESVVALLCLVGGGGGNFSLRVQEITLQCNVFVNRGTVKSPMKSHIPK